MAHMRQERCYESIASCLTRTLIVPKIYFERRWPYDIGSRIDIIAVDRAGTGDIHVVEVKESLNVALTDGLEFISNIPAHYRWVAFPGQGLLQLHEEDELKLLSEEGLYPDEGMGRIGVIEVIQMANNEIGARIRIRAERFRFNGSSEMIENFIDNEEADIEFKE